MQPVASRCCQAAQKKSLTPPCPAHARPSTRLSYSTSCSQQHHASPVAEHSNIQQQRQHAGVPTRQHIILNAGFGFGSKAKTGPSKASSKDCPCGSGKLYSNCCQVYHKSAAAHPDTPERLLQARYSAFVKKVPKYLRTTSHPDNPALKGSSTTLEDGSVKSCSFEEDLAVTFLSLEFLGLDIVDRQVAADGSSATVDARARFKRLVDGTGKRVSKPQEQVWLERASLVKDDEGHWLVKDVREVKAAEAPAAEQ